MWVDVYTLRMILYVKNGEILKTKLLTGKLLFFAFLSDASASHEESKYTNTNRQPNDPSVKP